MTADKINILMVDDQPAKLLSYEVILADLGENLIKAHSASDALNILLKTDIAVVLMDVSMPDVDGFELADVIRQHPRFQKTAIIFISGVHLADSDKIQGYRSGAVDYISVPVIPEVLRAKVAVFVELHRKTRMLEKLNSELERRVMERTEELQQSEARFRTQANLLELVSEAIIVRGLEGVPVLNRSMAGPVKKRLARNCTSCCIQVFPFLKRTWKRLSRRTGAGGETWFSKPEMDVKSSLRAARR